jgi:hypothetical protein
MFTRIWWLLVVLVLVGVSPSVVGASDDGEMSVTVLGGIGFSSVGNQAYLHSHGSVLVDQGEYRACYGVIRLPRMKERYIYLMLFKNDPGMAAGDTQEIAAREVMDGFMTATKIVRGGKNIEITYHLQLDRAGRYRGESIKLGDTVLDADAPRVYLVDLKEEKVTFQPVKVELPKSIPLLRDGPPDFTGKTQAEWAAAMLSGIKELEEKSEEVRKFLHD